MKFTAIAAAALPVVAMASPQFSFPGFSLPTGVSTGGSASPSGAPDNSKLVEKDIDAIKSNTIKLNQTLSTIPPQNKTIAFGTLITLLGNAGDINTALNKTITDTKSSATFNPGDQAVIGIQNIDLSNTVSSLLDNFLYRVQAFKNQGVAQIVAQNLNSSKSASADYSTAIAAKLGALGAFAPAISGPLNDKFTKVVQTYSSP